MTTGEIAMWSGVSVAGTLMCGLFAGLETGVYSLNRVRLHLLAHQHDRRAMVLLNLVADPTRLLAALLIATNIATNIATSAMGVLFEARLDAEWKVILAVVLLETPMLFIFAETLPKDLFSAHADRIVYPFARFMLVIKIVLTLTGILPLLSLMSTVLMRVTGNRQRVSLFHPRIQVTTLVKEGVGFGLLSDEQSAIVERVLSLTQRTVRDEMTPWADVETASVDDPPSRLWDIASRTSVSRIPVIAADGSVTQAVNLYDALLFEPATCPPIADLMKPMAQFEATMHSRQALAQLQSSPMHMALVHDEGKPLGVVTLKDLIEPITGELASW